MIRRKETPYWHEFEKYKSHSSFEDVFQSCNVVENEFSLTLTHKIILNTLKLHSKTFLGVCWLKIQEIADKAERHYRTVLRALSDLEEAGIIQIINWMHNKRGGKAHNIYVINNFVDVEDVVVEEEDIEEEDEPLEEPEIPVDNTPDISLDISPVTSNVTSSQDALPPCPIRDERLSNEPYSNSNNNSHTNSNNTILNNKEIKDLRDKRIDSLSIKEELYAEKLKRFPSEIVSMFSPYYSSNEIIFQRCVTTMASIKRSGWSEDNVDMNTVKRAWKETVLKIKSGTVRDEGGYYYTKLSAYLIDEYVDYLMRI